MELKGLKSILLWLLLTIICKISARTFTNFDNFISTPDLVEQRFNNDYAAFYQTRPVAKTDSLVGRLKRGYYYIEDGKITPVSPTTFNNKAQAIRRRQDSFSKENGKSVKPKKLFVPNLFG